MTPEIMQGQVRLWREWCEAVIARAEAHDAWSRDDLRGHKFTPEQSRDIKRALERHIQIGKAMAAETLRASLDEFAAQWLPEQKPATGGLRLVVDNEAKTGGAATPPAVKTP
jgi:hypothetical protein